MSNPSGFAMNLHAAAVRIDDVLHDGETDPHALDLARQRRIAVEFVEEPWHRLRADPDPPSAHSTRPTSGCGRQRR